MKNECYLIRDLLPLYAEDMVSDYTKSFVKKHLEDCPECNRELSGFQEVPNLSPDVNTAPLRALKRKLLTKKIQTILFTVALMLVLAVAAFAYLTVPRYVPYSSDLLTLTENADGTVTIAFHDSVTNHSYWKTKPEDVDCTAYFIEAWNTPLAQLLHWKNPQSLTIVPEAGEIYNLYYAQNGSSSQSDVLLYSTSLYNNYDVYTLPRLALGYYLMLAAALCVVFALAVLIFWKKKHIRIWIERLLLLPISYILGHICIKGFSTISYSMQRDFLFIVFATLLIYCALLLGLNLYRNHQNKLHH